METETTGPALAPYKDEVLGVLTVGLKTASSRRPALAGLQGMATTENLLTDEELGFVVHNVNEILEADSDELDDVRSVTFHPISIHDLVKNLFSAKLFSTSFPLLPK
jgi:DNA repair/transcription protein MET18/MMS19